MVGRETIARERFPGDYDWPLAYLARVPGTPTSLPIK